jgi:branched-chain amino acid transport system ATP-binding protein
LVLDGVSFTLDGASAAIVGRNGMGKTTLCRAIMGIEPPMAEGGVRLNGRELDGLPSYAICSAGIGYVAQGRELFPSLTVDEHLRMIGRRLVSRGRWSVDRVYELFPQLAQRRQLSGAQLSGGEQQMLAIGRALMGQPRLLLLDEPSMGLAPKLIQQIFSIIADIREQGTTILLVEQNAAQALKIADRAYILETGEVVREGTGDDLAADDSVRAAYLGGDV